MDLVPVVQLQSTGTSIGPGKEKYDQIDKIKAQKALNLFGSQNVRKVQVVRLYV
jgi:hypothetical protein